MMTDEYEGAAEFTTRRPLRRGDVESCRRGAGRERYGLELGGNRCACPIAGPA